IAIMVMTVRLLVVLRFMMSYQLRLLGINVARTLKKILNEILECHTRKVIVKRRDICDRQKSLIGELLHLSIQKMQSLEKQPKKEAKVKQLLTAEKIWRG